MTVPIKPGDPLFPVASITAGPLPSIGVAVIRFDFLAHAMQAPEAAEPGRNYALTLPQVRHLQARLAECAQMLESSPSGTGSGPRH